MSDTTNMDRAQGNAQSKANIPVCAECKKELLSERTPKVFKLDKPKSRIAVKRKQEEKDKSPSPEPNCFIWTD